MTSQIIPEHAQHVSEWVDVFSQHQIKDGSVRDDYDAMQDAQTAINNVKKNYYELCKTIGGRAVTDFEIFDSDTKNWQAAGLHTPPDFIDTHQYWSTPNSPRDAIAVIVAPLRIPNGYRGDHFALNFALMTQRHLDRTSEQVISAVSGHIPDVDPATIVMAPIRSRGFSAGDGSVVFSELLASKNRASAQKFGAFIVTGFQERYHRFTNSSQIPLSSDLRELLDSSSKIEEERSVWLQVHDRFHEIGDRPHSENLGLKMNFAAAVIDELKADGSAFLALQRHGGDWSAAAFRNVIDKMFRFPFSPYGYMSVDGAVGELLLKDAILCGGVTVKDGLITLNEHHFVVMMEHLIEEILNIESQKEEQQYLQSAKRFMDEKNVNEGALRSPLRWQTVLGLL